MQVSCRYVSPSVTRSHEDVAASGGDVTVRRLLIVTLGIVSGAICVLILRLLYPQPKNIAYSSVSRIVLLFELCHTHVIAMN